MQLDRNENSDGKGKYAIVNLRKVDGNPKSAQDLVEAISKNPESVEFGKTNSPDEFWVIKLKDKYATTALQAYADAIRVDDPDFAAEVDEMVKRSGPNSPFCKTPD